MKRLLFVLALTLYSYIALSQQGYWCGKIRSGGYVIRLR